jgi:hypothetical protein
MRVLSSTLVALSLTLAACASLAHAAEPADARVQREVRVYRMRAPRAPQAPQAPAVIPVPQSAIEAYAPDAPDAPASPPVYWEFAFPAGRRSYEVRTDTTVQVQRGMALALENLAGDISVVGWKKNAVRIRAQHSKRDRIVVQVQRGVVAIEAMNRAGLPPIVEYDLAVPEWMTLRLSALESDIRVRNMQAPVAAECMRGDIHVSDSHGPLQLSSIEGEVAVEDARDVQATSINNLVQLARIVGQIEVESVNGDIEMRQVTSPRVLASSMSGSVMFSGVFEPRGHYRLSSHTGNLRVGVPVGAGVDVTVASFNGAFQSSLPLQVGRQRRGRRFNFTLGTGGSTLELESFQGLIQLMPPSALPPPDAPDAPKAPDHPNKEDK